jgi:hypothetical protein
MEVFDAIFNVTNAQYVVDTSKRIFRFRSMYEWYPERIKVVVLHRDYRAVVHSQMKRGLSLAEGARSWALALSQIETLSDDIPASSITRLRYEDLCAEPTLELKRVCQFLGLAFEAVMLSRPTSDIHDIGGSPSKLEAGRTEIRLDSDYLQAFSPAQLDQMRRLVGSKAEQYGYE